LFPLGSICGVIKARLPKYSYTLSFVLSRILGQLQGSVRNTPGFFTQTYITKLKEALMASKAEIQSKIDLNNKPFNSKLRQTEGRLSKFGRSVAKVSARLAKMGFGAAAAGFALLSRNAIQLGSYLSDVATSTGFATEQFQVFRGALIDAGGKAESMEKAILLMNKAIVQGDEGMTTYTRAFDRLGLNVTQLRAMRPEEAFEVIGKSIAGATDQQGSLIAAIEIFGQRNAPRLIEVFKRLDSEGYGKMAKDIEKAYGIMDAETQAALDKAADRIERFKSKATIFVGELISGEGSGAALKILGIQLTTFYGQMAVAGLEFVAKLASGTLAGAYGILQDILSKLETGLKIAGLSLVNAIKDGLNQVIPMLNKIPKVELDLISIDDSKITKLKSQLTSTLDFTKAQWDSVWNDDMFDAWKELLGSSGQALVDEQKAVIDSIRKANLKASSIWGDNGGTSGTTGGTSGGDPGGELSTRIQELKLALIEVEISGKKELIDAARLQLEREEKINQIMQETNVSRERAIALANEIAAQDDAREQTKEQRLQEMNLALLKAEARGEDALAAQMNERINLAERMLAIKQETGATDREALIIADAQMRKEAAANAAGEDVAKAAKDDGIRGKIRTGRIGDGRRDMPTMAERERANRLYNTTLGRSGFRSDFRPTYELPGAVPAGGSAMVGTPPTARDRASGERGGSGPATSAAVAEVLRSLKIIEAEFTGGR
jgi:hypothetical protein